MHTVTLTTAQYIITIGTVFIALMMVPYIADFLYYLDEENAVSWFGAGVRAAILASVFIAVVTRIAGV